MLPVDEGKSPAREERPPRHNAFSLKYFSCCRSALLPRRVGCGRCWNHAERENSARQFLQGGIRGRSIYSKTICFTEGARVALRPPRRTLARILSPVAWPDVSWTISRTAWRSPAHPRQQENSESLVSGNGAPLRHSQRALCCYAQPTQPSSSKRCQLGAVVGWVSSEQHWAPSSCQASGLGPRAGLKLQVVPRYQMECRPPPQVPQLVRTRGPRLCPRPGPVKPLPAVSSHQPVYQLTPCPRSIAWMDYVSRSLATRPRGREGLASDSEMR